MASKKTGNSFLMAAGAAAIGLFLLATAAPRLAQSALILGTDKAVTAVRSGESVSASDIADAIALLDRASIMGSAGEVENLRGQLLLRQAQEQDTEGRRKALYAEAALATERSLGVSPAQPQTWLRLALLRERQQDLTGGVAALRLSILAGGFAPNIMTTRLALGLRLWPHLPEGDRQLVERQIRLTWAYRPNKVLDLAARPEYAGTIMKVMIDMNEAGFNDHDASSSKLSR